MVSNYILAFSLYKGMLITATIVAYAFSVQCFENAIIVAYAGLSVKRTIRKP